MTTDPEPDLEPVSLLPLGRLAASLAGVWGLAVVIGALVLAHQPVTGITRLSAGRATFQAVSAASLTGFRVSWSEMSQLPPVEQAVLGILIAIGVVTAWALPVLALLRLARIPRHTSLVRIAAVALGIPVGIILVGLLAGLLAGFLGRGSGGNGPPVAAIWIDTLAAFGNCGLTWHQVTPLSPAFWFILTPLALFGAAGPALCAGLVWRSAPLRAHLRLLLVATASAFLGAVLLCLVTVAGVTPWETDPQRLAAAVALATDTRSSAFTDTLGTLPRQTQAAAVPLMLLGTAGGTGGGLRVTVAAVLVVGLWRLLRNGGRVGRTFAMAGLWLLTLGGLFLGTYLALLATTPELPADRVAILAAGACGNVGLSVNPVTAMGADAYILAAAMLLGRLLPWGLLFWSATRGDEPVVLG